VKSYWKYFNLSFIVILMSNCSSTSSTIKENPPEKANRTLVIAHRGARSLAPENTLAAAKKALDLQADLWELDVAVTSDGELVVVHDDTLERTCNVIDLFPGKVPWRVWEFTLEEIKTLDCGSWFNETDPFKQIKSGNVSQEEMDSYVGEPMPTLREALEFTLENHWRVNVELKDQPNDQLGTTLVEKTVSLISELGMDTEEQVVISSFNHEYLKKVRSLNSNITIQALTNEKIKNLSEYLTNLGTKTCNPKVDVWNPGELEELGREGIHFNVYTVNDEAKMKQLIAANVQGIFTDFPQILTQLLSSQ
jgi:glycerophosphoryl diester phosphodiesterase